MNKTKKWKWLAGIAVAAFASGTCLYTERTFGTDPLSYWRYPISQPNRIHLNTDEQAQREDLFVRWLRFGTNSQHLWVNHTSSGEEKSVVKQWNIETESQTTIFSDPILPASAISASEERKRFMTAGNAPTAQLWDVKTGALKETFAQSNGQSNSSMHRAVLSPTGEVIAAAQYDDGSQRWQVGLWDAQTGEQRQALAYVDLLPTIRFSPQGRFLAIATANSVQLRSTNTDINTDPIWEISAEEELQSDYPNAIIPLSFSNDGTRLTISRSQNSDSVQLQQIQVDTGEILHSIMLELGGYIQPVASPNGEIAAYVSENEDTRQEEISLIEITTGKVVQTITTKRTDPGDIRSLAFSPDGNMLASAYSNGSIDLHTIASQETASLPPIEQYSGFGLAFQDNHSLLVRVQAWMTESDQPVLRDRYLLIDAQTGQPKQQFEPVRSTFSPSFSQDGSVMLATVIGRTVNTWDVHDGSTHAQLTYQQRVDAGDTASLVMSRNGQTYALSNSTYIGDREDPSILIGDADTGQIMHRIETSSPLEALALSPNGKILAATNKDRTVQLWDTLSSELLHELPAEPVGLASGSPVTDLVFSDDGTLLLMGDQFTVQLWRVDTGESLHSFSTKRPRTQDAEYWHEEQGVKTWRGAGGVAISADNAWVAAGDMVADKIYIWDSNTGELLRVIDTKNNNPTMAFLSFSPDKKTLAASGSRSDLYTWQLPAKLSLF